MHRGWRWIAFALLPVAVSFNAHAFDCSRASTQTEKRICSDPSLLDMDKQMDALYRKVARGPGDAQAWKADQRAWIAERDHCDDAACLRQEYHDRLIVLRTGEPRARWAGHWWRVDATGSNGAELVIKQSDPKSLSFELNASGGANSGELSGTAKIDGLNSAHYQGSGDTEGCKLAFRRAPNRLDIDQSGDSASCGAGFGVYFSGTYVVSDKDPNGAPDLISLGVLESKDQDDAVRKLLGKDYDTMVASADMVDAGGESLDGNGATVINMSVRGLACVTKSVLMFDRKGDLWAAVWEPVSGSSGTVELRYYTNVKGDKHALPKTIASERDACSGDSVRVRMMP